MPPTISQKAVICGGKYSLCTTPNLLGITLVALLSYPIGRVPLPFVFYRHKERGWGSELVFAGIFFRGGGLLNPFCA